MPALGLNAEELKKHREKLKRRRLGLTSSSPASSQTRKRSKTNSKPSQVLIPKPPTQNITPENPKKTLIFNIRMHGVIELLYPEGTKVIVNDIFKNLIFINTSDINNVCYGKGNLTNYITKLEKIISSEINNNLDLTDAESISKRFSDHDIWKLGVEYLDVKTALHINKVHAYFDKVYEPAHELEGSGIKIVKHLNIPENEIKQIEQIFHNFSYKNKYCRYQLFEALKKFNLDTVIVLDYSCNSFRPYINKTYEDDFIKYWENFSKKEKIFG